MAKSTKASLIKPLSCGLCGKTVIGRQWHKRKEGNSICPHCFSWLKSTCENMDILQINYGIEGYHFNIQGE